MDTEWKFTRTKMWLNWIYKKSVIPPPLSIVYVLLPGFWVMKHLFKACCPEAILVSIEIYSTVFRFSTRSTFWAEKRLQGELSKSHTHLLTFIKSTSTKPVGLVNHLHKPQDQDKPQSPSHWIREIAPNADKCRCPYLQPVLHLPVHTLQTTQSAGVFCRTSNDSEFSD